MKVTKSGNPRRLSKAVRLRRERDRLEKKFGKESFQLGWFLKTHPGLAKKM